jgi:hypothetical protein
MAETDDTTRSYRIKVLCEEDQQPQLLDVVGFLFDFNLLYETARRGADPAYDEVEARALPPRGKLPPRLLLRSEDRLRLELLRHESPMELVTLVGVTVGATAALWTMVQTVLAVYNAPLNREKLELERQKLEIDLRKQMHDLAVASPTDDDRQALLEIQRRLEERNAEPMLRRIVGGLAKSGVRLKELTIEITDRVNQQKK